MTRGGLLVAIVMLLLTVAAPVSAQTVTGTILGTVTEGFKARARQNLQLTVGAELVINFSLEIGTVEETVVVTSGVIRCRTYEPEY